MFYLPLEPIDLNYGFGGSGIVGGFGGVSPESPGPLSDVVTTCINGQSVCPGMWLGYGIAWPRVKA